MRWFISHGFLPGLSLGLYMLYQEVSLDKTVLDSGGKENRPEVIFCSEVNVRACRQIHLSQRQVMRFNLFIAKGQDCSLSMIVNI